MIVGSGCGDERQGANESADKGRRPAENPRRSAPVPTRRLDAYDSDPAPVHQRSPHDGCVRFRNSEVSYLNALGLLG
jgi:hypothetical protein